MIFRAPRVAPRIEARRATEAVLSALVRHVDARIFDEIEGVLPAELRAHLVIPEPRVEPEPERVQSVPVEA